MKIRPLLNVLLVFMNLIGVSSYGQTAEEIIRKAESKWTSSSTEAEVKIEIVRPSWSREMRIKSWTKGEEYAMILIKEPARDEGTAYLKREEQAWNWLPRIQRMVRMPPSMMSQSWMGSDLSNDDLLGQSSRTDDYTHSLAGEEIVNETPCYKIVLIRKPESPVVWEKVVLWISKDNYIEMKVESYDDLGEKVNTLIVKETAVMDGESLPSVLEMIPADKKGHKTIMKYISVDFNAGLDESFFNIQQLKRLN